jgi:peroxiredoxin
VVVDASPEVGSKAPDFTVLDEFMRPYWLSEHYAERNVMLLFYPADFGMMCAVEMRTMRDRSGEFAAAGVELVAISTNTTYSHGYFKDTLSIPFSMLADVDGKASALFGVLSGEDGYLKGRANRAVFLIDRSGIIAYKWIAEDPAYEPDYDELLAEAMRIRDG